ncbi:hypothetical protein OsI_07031 [Oryza sativa Indica Group]|uniref:Uncharacterized protein n=1 Tax=Oryza sativa subsp. indica TaxID=39946 RepID=B8AGP2_ORYSI|nr:hypothetical protein OsI_07031 [Oryza sativa Indica Group]
MAARSAAERLRDDGGTSVAGAGSAVMGSTRVDEVSMSLPEAGAGRSGRRKLEKASRVAASAVEAAASATARTVVGLTRCP